MSPGSFFAVGRERRETLRAAHEQLDPIAGELVRDEMRERWWRHVLVGVPLAWCGLWVGGPLEPAARTIVCLQLRPRQFAGAKPVLLLYAAPALVMLALHAAVANHYTRYNLILIGPFSAGAAWMMTRIASRVTERRRARAVP